MIHANGDPDSYLKKQLLITAIGPILMAVSSMPGRWQLRALDSAINDVAVVVSRPQRPPS